MTTHISINEALKPYREQLINIIADTEYFFSRENNIKIDIPDLEQQIKQLKQRVKDPFMFVIVGEVKAGKSSFINALLESEICTAAPDPCTAIVQQIVYGEKEITETDKDENGNDIPFFERKKMPIDILKGIAVVDTPGTGVLIQMNGSTDKHQSITEKFIPFSDLIMFVFLSKNPFHHETWAFFENIYKKWKKHVVFILQQADLMEEDELEVNKQWVLKIAQERGLKNAPLFSVSARKELRGKKSESGFESVRNHIDQYVTGGKAYLAKLVNAISTLEIACSQIENKIKERENDLRFDSNILNKVEEILKEGKDSSISESKRLARAVSDRFNEVAKSHESELRDRTQFGNLLSKEIWATVGLGGEKLNTWLESFKEKLKNDLEKEIYQVLIKRIKEDLFAHLRLKITSPLIAELKTSLTHSHNKQEREAVFASIEQMDTVLKNGNSGANSNAGLGAFLGKRSVLLQLAYGVGLTSMGAVVGSVSTLAVIDISGGILTALGLLFTGFSLWNNTAGVADEFQKNIKAASKELEKQIANELSEEIETFIANINQSSQFIDFKSALEKESKVIEKNYHHLTNIRQKISELDNTLSKFE